MPTPNSEGNPPNPVIIPIGGFLGAGKTSLILAAARILQQGGIRCAAILNDQGKELADTRWVQSQGLRTDEVVGGCFCCLFSDMVDAAERLRAHSAQVIFAEAVGSCTDISATTLQPLKLYHGDKFRLAPYTVLVDPARAKQLLSNESDGDLTFLFQKQVEEADLICFTRSDLWGEVPEGNYAAPVRRLSSITGAGIQSWLDEVLSGTLGAGTKIVDIDYEHYARAEARLAWLNSSASLTLESPLSPSALVGPLLDALQASLIAHKLQIAHLKITDDTPAGFLKASLIANGDEPSIQGDLAASSSAVHELLVNARVAGEPAVLQSLVERHLYKLPGKLHIRSLQCFKPSPPVPEHRMTEVVGSSAE
jgi:hypothetical protein